MHLRLVYCLFIASLSITGVAGIASGKPARNIRLEQAIQSYYLSNHKSNNLVLKYLPAYTDLNNDGRKDAVVFIFGDCGATACPLLIATLTKKGYQVISELRPVRTPIWVSQRRSNGWHNIVVMEGGTANDQPFRSVYRFDGKSYVEDTNDTGKRGKLLIGKNVSPLDAIPLKIEGR